MKKTSFLVFALAALVACTNDTKTAVDGDSKPQQEQTEVAVEPNKVLSMEVDGMVCKMGCGGSIRKGLKETGGVSRVEFDFDEDRKTNFAKVYFNSEKISKDEIVSVVADLNEKQFTVGAVEVEDFEDVSSDEVETTSNESDVQIDAYSSNVEVPNLLELLSGLFV